jgi:GntR family transcriptional regulator
MLRIDPNISIYVQLADYLRIGIYSGQRKPGSKMPSIRDMAIELEVNPNTIKRVYQALLADGLIYTNGTLGNFVTEDEGLIEHQKTIYLSEKTRTYVDLLKACKANVDNVFKEIKEATDDPNHQR